MFKFSKSSWLCRRGQIVIPSLLVIPSLIIFIYLLFETAKLSREKIRQQFAVDSAAFIEMTNYSDIFNRTAYINGAYPFRIFKQTYNCSDSDNLVSAKVVSKSSCIYDLLWDTGAIPRTSPKDDSYQSEYSQYENSNTNEWKIKYNDVDDRKKIYDKVPSSSVTMGENRNSPFYMFSQKQAVDYDIVWDRVVSVFQFYAQAYILLGQVQNSQWIVFNRVTSNFTFFRKSYYLNAATQDCINNPSLCGEDGLTGGSNSFSSKAGISEGRNYFSHYMHYISFFAKKSASTLIGYQVVKPRNPMDMTENTANGLYQLSTFTEDKLKALGDGIDVYQPWTAPSNYFGIGFGTPKVHAKVASQCPKLGSSHYNNCVWPNPTPKYQTRLFP